QKGGRCHEEGGKEERGEEMSFKGQSTLELLILFSGGLLALMVVAAVLPSFAAGNASLYGGQLARDSTSYIARVSDEVYLQGEGAQKSIWINVPETASVSGDSPRSFIGSNDAGADWSDRKMVDLYLANEGDIFAISRAPLCGQWPAAAGRYLINIQYSTNGDAHVAINEDC
ncbi:MAG: hypothetical protein V1822_02620, partial [Candidatus Micrarchaeota archaeon]